MKIDNLKFVLIFLLIVSTIEVHAQTSISIESPDANASLLITSAEVGDGNTEWKYWLIQTNKDTTLLSTAVTHDDMRPVSYWTSSSQELIYEERGQPSKIRIYNVHDRKVRFETVGFIWGDGDYNFDSERGLLFYFKRIEENRKFDLVVLDIVTLETKTLSSFTTSGDPITGAPQIQSIDLAHKQLILNFENEDWNTEKIEVDY